MNSTLNLFSKLVVVCAGLAIGLPHAFAQEGGSAPSISSSSPSVSRSDSPSLDQGWDTTGGLLFGLQNIFQDPGILESFRGFGFGAQYNLDNTTALRLGLSLSRSSNPAFTVTETSKAGGTTVTTERLTNTGGPTSTSNVGVGVDYLKRMNTSAVSPYFGGGVTFNWANVSTQFTDDISVDGQTTTVDNSTNSVAVGLQGVLGIGWRVHQSFSLFAEYSLGIDVLRNTSAAESTIVETAGVTSETSSEASQNRLFNFDLNLAQGASLGVIAFF